MAVREVVDEAGEHAVTGTDRGAGPTDRGAGVGDTVGVDEDGPVTAETDRDPADAVRDELGGGIDDIAEGGQVGTDELFELDAVGLDQVGTLRDCGTKGVP